MQRPFVRLSIITVVTGAIIFGVIFVGVQASNHVPWYISFPLVLAIIILWLFAEYTDG